MSAARIVELESTLSAERLKAVDEVQGIEASKQALIVRRAHCCLLVRGMWNAYMHACA